MLRFALTGIALAAAVIPAEAQSDAANFPNRAIRIIVPFPPGGPTDIIARFVGQRMSERWSQPVVIENRAGANTAIGAQIVAKSAPDGLTLLAVGIEPGISKSPEEFGAFIKTQAETREKVIKAVGMKLD